MVGKDVGAQEPSYQVNLNAETVEDAVFIRMEARPFSTKSKSKLT